MADQTKLDIEAFRRGKAEFDEAHRRGMDALRRRDYADLDEAIQTERGIVEDQQAALKHALGVDEKP